MVGILLAVIDSSKLVLSKALETTSSKTEVLNMWLWIAIIEFLIIAFLLLKQRSKKQNLDFSDISKNDLKNSKNEKLDMHNLMNSIHGARDLYKELSKKCHPDRFINQPNQKLAEEIFQEITNEQRNHEKLVALKERAIKELNVKF